MRKLTMRWTAVACCALSACLLAPAAARAQGSPPPTAVDDDVPGNNTRAAQLYREGNEAFKEKRWSDAELLYLKAWALVRSFDIAANLGEVQLKLNKPRSAAAFLAFSLRTAPPSAKPPHVERVRRYLDEARKQVGTLRVRVKNVADAEVLVDGERVPEDAVKHEMYVEPGERTLVIRRAGYEDEVVRVVAAAGVTETLMPELKPKAVKAAEAKPPEASEAEPAKLSEAPIVAPARSAEAHASGPRKVVLIAGAVTAGAAAVAGVVFTVLANTNAANADEKEAALGAMGGPNVCAAGRRTTECGALRRLEENAATFGNVSAWSFIGAGVVGVATAIVWAVDSRAEWRAGLHASPMVGAHEGGIMVRGTW